MVVEVPDNFLGIGEEFSNYENAKVVVLSAPLDKTTSYGKGTDNGPRAIIEASKQIEWYDDELDKEIVQEIGIHTLPELNFENDSVEEALKKIEEESKKHIEKEKFVVMLGGEHSVTQALVKAYSEKFSDLSVLQIDAHSDLRQEYDGSIYSHASVMKRILDMDIKTVQIGIRSQDIEEVNLIKEKNLNIFYAKDIWKDREDEWMDKAIEKLTDNVFITIDIDGLDPSIIPSTGTPEPGGLSWYQILKFLRKVAEKKKIVGFDVVELAPISGYHSADFLSAKLVYKLLGYVFNKQE